MMNDQNDKNLIEVKKESESKSDDLDKQEIKEVDAIKTGSKKKARYHDKPFDEQMHESFNDIREKEGIQDDDKDD